MWILESPYSIARRVLIGILTNPIAKCTVNLYTHTKC